MKILENPHILQEEINLLKKHGRTIGFVPTMGALHEGHLALVREAANHCDTVICSVFVNPSQFNNEDDYNRYPRQKEADAALLESTPCFCLFIPGEKDIYPDDSYKTPIDFGYLEKVLEGKFRPGHFKGVGMVVKRLFELVQPHKAFFGLKDYQQFLIIKELVKKFDMKTDIHGLLTVREEDGLAMSSRNRLLNEEERKQALILSKMLSWCKDNYDHLSLYELKKEVAAEIKKYPLARMEYFEIADAENLHPVHSKEEIHKVIALTAVYIGKVRLIDNMFM